MEREIKVRFVGDASDIKRASEEARRALNSMGRDTVDFGQRARESNRAVSESTRSMSGSMVAELGRMAAAYASVGAAAAIFWKGLAHNAEIESLKLGMATIVSANETITDAAGKQVEGAAKLGVAQGQVAKVFEQMKLDAINTTATLPQLAQAFNAALAPAMAMGISLDDTRKMTVGMVQAMGAMGIPLDQARQEINSILQAQISEDSQLAKNLGLNNEMVKGWKEQGTLVDNLNAKLKDFTVAGAEAGKTWNGVTSTLADNMGDLLGVLTGDSFETLKTNLGSLNKGFGDEAQQDAARWGAIINDSLTSAIALAGGVGTVLLKGAKLFQQALNDIQIGGAKLGGMVLRSDLIHQAVADLPERGNALTGGSPEGIHRVGKLLPNFLPENMSPSDIAAVMQKAGLSGAELEKFKKRLEEIDKMVNAGVEGQTDEILNGWERQLKQILADAKKNAGFKAVARKPAPGPAKPGKAAGPAHGLLDGLDLGGTGSALDRAASGIFLSPSDRGGLGVSGNGLGYNGIGQQVSAGTELGVLTGLTSPVEEAVKYAPANDLLLRNIKDYKGWKDEEAKQWQSLMANVAQAAGGLAGDAINGRSVSGGDLLRSAGTVASMFGPWGTVAGVGLGVGASFLDRNDANLDATERYRRLMSASGSDLGSLRSRQQALQSEVDKRSKESYWIWEANKPKELQDLSKALGDVTKELGALDNAASVLSTAMQAAGRSAASFQGVTGVENLRSQITGKQLTASEYINLVAGSQDLGGRGIYSDRVQGAKNLLGSTDSMSQALSLYEQIIMGGGSNLMGSADQGQKLAQLLGRDDLSNTIRDRNLGGSSWSDATSAMAQLSKLFQDVFMPAMSQLASMGGTMRGSISGAGTEDTALQFDAPQTRMITNNFTISLETFAVTGDKASFRAFVREVMAEAATMGGLAV